MRCEVGEGLRGWFGYCCLFCRRVRIAVKCLIILHFMKNQPHWNQSFQELKSDEGNYLSSQLSSHRDDHENINAQLRDQTQSMHPPSDSNEDNHLQPLIQASRDDGSNDQQGFQPSQKEERSQQEVFEGGNAPTYIRVSPNGQREVIKVISVCPRQPNQVTISQSPPINVMAPVHLPPHYPPSPRMSHIPTIQKTNEFKSLDNARQITQQSFAPSQKTIVLNHIANQINGVYHSHVATERMPIQQARESNTRHSHIQQSRMASPTRVNFDYQSKPEAMVVRNALFNSYIPTSNPIIIERVGAISSSNAPMPSEMHFDHPEQANFWRQKYEQLSRRWEATRSKETKEQGVGQSKFAALEKNYQLLQSNYDELVQQYHSKLDENQKYYEQIQEMQNTINQRQLSSPTKNQDQSNKLSQLLKEKEQQIKKLTAKLEQSTVGNESELQGAFEEKSMLVGLLKKENEQLQAHIHEFELRYESEMHEMNEHTTMLQMEIEQREAQLRERSLMKNSAMRRSDNSQLMLDRSRMESFENTRVMQLEMHIGKLNAELNMREESFERELKMANLNVTELVDRLRTLANEKDQTIRNLQEKIGFLESDINKKESIIRNLRDEASNRFSPPAATVYSSAVNPADHRVGEKEEVYKKQLENLRRNLFEREREKMILKQKYEELEEKVEENEEALGKKKLENQSIRRQLNDFDNLQHENDKLMEVLNKKNAEILEMKEMLFDKDQYAGDFENLSKENDRLRNVMVKKNEELSEMADRLYTQEKRVRELELIHTPQVHEFEDEIERLKDMLDRKEHEINKLNQSLELVEGNFSEIEFQLERHRNITQQYEALIRINMEKIQHYEEEFAHFEDYKQESQEEVHIMRGRIEDLTQKLNEKAQSEMAVMRHVEELSRELEMREQDLKEIVEEQTSLKQFKLKSAKELQLFENKHGEFQLRCRDLESMLRNREQRLVRAEKEAEQAREQMKKHQKCAKLIEQMTQKISNYEMKVISLTMNRGYSGMNDYPQPGQVFENRIIYRLKQQNEALRQEIGSLKNYLSPVPPNPKGSQNGDTFVKNRLGQFNANLHNTIDGPGLKRVRSVETLVATEKESVIQQQNRQIERLKQLAQEMQREELERSTSTYKKHITPEYIDLVFQEELTFYRSKNKELEERVANLLKVNKELKATLEDSLLNKNSSMKTFYENEIKRLEKELTQGRIERGRSNEQLKEYEHKMKELQQNVQSSKKRNRMVQSPEHTQVSYNFLIGARMGSLIE